MIKIIALVTFFLLVNLNGKVFQSPAQKGDKESAIERATWMNFEKALSYIAGDQSISGSLVDSFKEDMNKDFEGFKEKYFDFSSHQCKELGEDGFYCEVKSNINLKKIRRHMKTKANSSRTMGKNTLSKLEIALIDNIDTEDSKTFRKALVSRMNKSGNKLYSLPKGTQVGRKGNKCKKFEQAYAKYKKKGDAYKVFADKAKQKLEQCDSNKEVMFAFSLAKLDFSHKKTMLDELEGTLTCGIDIINAQTSRDDKTIDDIVVTTTEDSVEALKLKLYKKAAKIAASEISSNMLDHIAEKQVDKKFKKSKLDSFEYMWTVVLMNATRDAADRPKLKVVREVIKKFGAKAKRNSQETKDFEQVYNFGTNEDIDVDDFIDELYDMTDSVGFQVQIEDNGNNVITIQFQ